MDVHLSHGVGGDWDIISTNDLTSFNSNGS
jgi:hypothetical protein